MNGIKKSSASSNHCELCSVSVYIEFGESFLALHFFARFEKLGPVTDKMECDSVEEQIIQFNLTVTSKTSHKDNQGLKCCEPLGCRMEADGSRRNTVLTRYLRHDRAIQVVGQSVRPDFFANQLWRPQSKLSLCSMTSIERRPSSLCQRAHGKAALNILS